MKCRYCEKELATQADYDSIPEGQGEHLCWSDYGQPCIDAEDALVKARARIAELEAIGEQAVRPPDEPQNLTEWLWRLKRYERGIFVREKVDGRWGNVALKDLTPERWAHHVARWLEKGALPCRIREQEEMQNAGCEL
jgi:hypothetical protein